jgi:hypothetical protein
MMHAGLGRKHPLNVDFVHLGASLGFIQDLLTEGILSHSRLKIERKIALVKAIGKVIWIQNDLFAKWHIKDAEQVGGKTREVEVEREGFLHGKRVLNTDEDVLNMTLEPETPSEEFSCPFSRLAVGMDKVDEKGNSGS